MRIIIFITLILGLVSCKFDRIQPTPIATRSIVPLQHMEDSFKFQVQVSSIRYMSTVSDSNLTLGAPLPIFDTVWVRFLPMTYYDWLNCACRGCNKHQPELCEWNFKWVTDGLPVWKKLNDSTFTYKYTIREKLQARPAWFMNHFNNDTLKLY